MPATRSWQSLIFILVFRTASLAHSASPAGPTQRHASFPQDEEGWTIVVGGEPGRRSEPLSSSDGLQYRDHGAEPWYFSSPPGFMQGTAGGFALYGGQIRYELSHRNFFSSTTSFAPDVADLVLLGEGGALCYHGAAISWTYSTAAAVSLHASSHRWVLASLASLSVEEHGGGGGSASAAAAGSHASEEDMLRVLSTLREVGPWSSSLGGLSLVGAGAC